MRILMLCDSMGIGGAETHVLTLCRALTERGHSVTLLSGGGESAEALGSVGTEHIALPLNSRRRRDMVSCARGISSILRKREFDLIHSHSRFSSALVNAFARRHALPHITTVHAMFSSGAFIRRICRWGDLSVAVSQDLKQYLIDTYKIAPENISVIHNGVSEERFFPQERTGGITVGFLSRLDGDCSLGAELLCAIAPRLAELYPHLRVLIGGGGESAPRIKALAAEANRTIGRDCVQCLGTVSDTPAFFNSCDLFVGVSRAAIEAAVCSAAVVICGNEGFFGVLEEDRFSAALAENLCARGCGAADGDKLFEAISYLLAEGRESLRLRGERLRALCREYCSSKRMAEQTERVYLRALGKTRGGESLLCGYYGFGNMGDDILLRAAIARARKEYGKEGIRVMTYGGRRDSRCFGEKCIRRTSLLSLPIALLRCRRLIFGGGTLLQSDTSRRSLLYYSSLIKIAALLGKSCILWGNGIGSVRGNIDRRILSRALDSCEYIGMRDMRSYALARHLLEKERERVKLECDLAEDADELYRDSERAEFLLGRLFGKEGGEIVAVMPRGRMKDSELLKFVKRLSDERKCGRALLFIAMNEREDRATCKALSRSLGGRIACGICFGDVVEMLKKCRRVYSMRLHGLVAAQLAGAEFVGVGRDAKIRAYCEERGAELIFWESEEI